MISCDVARYYFSNVRYIMMHSSDVVKARMLRFCM